MQGPYDVRTITEVVKQEFSKLKEAYGFEDYSTEVPVDFAKPFNLAIRKKNVVIEVFISNREGFRVIYRRSSWPTHKNRDLFSLLALLFKDDRRKRDEFLAEFFAKQSEYPENSEGSFRYALVREIDFIKTYFPQILDGKFDMF